MTGSARDGYVLVGVDHGPESVAAATWAVECARSRGRDLILAHGIPLPYGDSPITGDLVDAIMAAANALVDDVVSQLVIPPELTVETLVRPSPPVALLRRLAQDADLVVLGRQQETLLDRLTEGTVTSPLVAHACCPVLVVPADYAATSGEPKPVVVALDGTTDARSALELAFDEAARQRADLVVLHARPLEELPMTAVDDVVTLAEILAGWKADRPEVEVRTVVVQGEADEVILAASAEAGLLIVARPHQPRLGAWARSVARAVLREARCPLAIVPPTPLPWTGGRDAHARVSEMAEN